MGNGDIQHSSRIITFNEDDANKEAEAMLSSLSGSFSIDSPKNTENTAAEDLNASVKSRFESVNKTKKSRRTPRQASAKRLNDKSIKEENNSLYKAALKEATLLLVEFQMNLRRDKKIMKLRSI